MAGKGDTAQGRRDNRRGIARQHECSAWLRDRQLYPRARHVGQYPGDAWQSDLQHVGPRVVEVTVEPFERIAAKLRQAEDAADHAGLAEFFVWKHIGRGVNETGAVADSAIITRARVLWPLLAELDELRAFTAQGDRREQIAAFRASIRQAAAS